MIWMRTPRPPPAAATCAASPLPDPCRPCGLSSFIRAPTKLARHRPPSIFPTRWPAARDPLRSTGSRPVGLTPRVAAASFHGDPEVAMGLRDDDVKTARKKGLIAAA